MDRFYFAYGSNLNVEQMAIRCPGAKPICKAILPGWELEFRRVLTIVRKEKGIVFGGLWRITESDEATLDRYEGYPSWYDKRIVLVNQCKIPAITYILDKGQPALPSNEYLRTCVKGCHDFDIDPRTMFQALDNLERRRPRAEIVHA